MENIEIVERFQYKQEISNNRGHENAGVPTGKITISIPYDGGQYFTREAIADTEKTAAAPGPDATALVGHLLLSDYDKTDLGSASGLDGSYGAVRIEVPIHGGRKRLAADRQECVLEHEYAPDPNCLHAEPITVLAELFDPDGVTLLPFDSQTDETSRATGLSTGDEGAGRLLLDKLKRLPSLPFEEQQRIAGLVTYAAENIAQQASFRSYLQLRLRVRLVLPRQDDGKHTDAPVLRRVSVAWPTITSLRAVHLHLLDASADPSPVITYNPVTKCLEWHDMPLRSSAMDSEDKSLQGYESSTMVLTIEQPGELYLAPELHGRVEVDVPDRLLSGTDARLFTATGMQAAHGPRLKTQIESEFKLVLGDAFTKRVQSPCQHLYFDEVIPDRARITDIQAALETRGYDVFHCHLGGDGSAGGSALRSFVLACRTEGPDQMALWIYVEGRHLTTERQSQVDGGTTYTTQLKSGDLRLYVRGTLAGHRRELVLEMNALQKALRDQFARIRQLT
ncbi:hypothetical protein [Streptomyces sp. CBMA123]|uniref:hypothetical protein n=1 Tax=Streptomyces sp. CBMA123 TaxID=1896313 RepID=UPI001661BD1E|nr:hypothetical protein [Streptomyces sp. CBMA123]MBD0695804.1 hypothetical protein [Streptomyces sp. CBMA123]